MLNVGFWQNLPSSSSLGSGRNVPDQAGEIYRDLRGDRRAIRYGPALKAF